MNQSHLHPPSLRILVLFNFNSNLYFVKHCNRCHRRRQRRWYRDRIILRIELRISLEHHQTFDAQPKQTINYQLIAGEKRSWLWHKDTQTIPECPNHESFFRHLYLLTCYLSFSLPTTFQSQSNIKLNTGPTCHLSHAVPMVDKIQNLLHMRFGVQRCMERWIANRSW